LFKWRLISLRQIFGLSGVGWIKITRNQNKQKNKLKNPIQNEVERKTWKNIQKGKKKQPVKPT